ncbi:MAG: acylneuraminate cytidylyltransferase [Propionibacteriaceae bacterium]|nr:acylneuraminate cytidylyltransferase [Propionibacteriaceae bacterium]
MSRKLASDAGPEVVAVIPARGGSKGVPGKNLAQVGGVPLVARTVRACLAATRLSAVVVSTDDQEIAAVARQAGAVVVTRPLDLSGDTASSEDAVVHALEVLYGSAANQVDVVVLVQCTSPFTTSEEIDQVVQAVLDGADTAFTGARFHGFLWRPEADGAVAVNHHHKRRARRQERPVELLETGAAYAMRGSEFWTKRRRFFGEIRAVPTDPERVLEIDEPEDLERARALAPLLDTHAGRPGRSDLDAVVLDFDGTQTDDRVWLDADGGEQVAVHRGDGMGVAALRRAGIEVLILSTEAHPVVSARAAKLGVECLQGVTRKGEALVAWCAEKELDLQRVLYLGNDVNDLPCFAAVGWPVAVASAHPPVRAAARAVTTVPGGHGAVREIASWILGKDLP